MRKLFFLIVCSQLALGAGWIDWYVDNTYEGESQGTEEAPFKTIQEAVAASLASNATFSADTIWIKGTGTPYYGPIEIPNKNAMRLAGYGEVKPEITVTGEVAATTIKSGDKYASPTFACMPPAQVGLQNLIVRNESENQTAVSYAADIQVWVSWEASVTGFPERIRYGVEDCEFYATGQNVPFRLRDLDQRHNQALVDADHWSMVTRCLFQGEGDLMHLSSQQKALITSNVFLGGTRALVFEGWTNAVYSRLTENIKIRQNRFFEQKDTIMYSGVCKDLEFSHNTCTRLEGTHISLTDEGLSPRETTYVRENIFETGESAIAFAETDWSELVEVKENLFNDVEPFGEETVVGDTDFLSLDPADPDFLRPGPNSAADREGYYLGALAPIPEPQLILGLFVLLGFLIRRR